MRTIAPDIESVRSESEEWLVLDRPPADTTRQELEAHSFDPTQGRKIGSDPYDDPTQGRDHDLDLDLDLDLEPDRPQETVNATSSRVTESTP